MVNYVLRLSQVCIFAGAFSVRYGNRAGYEDVKELRLSKEVDGKLTLSPSEGQFYMVAFGENGCRTSGQKCRLQTKFRALQ